MKKTVGMLLGSLLVASGAFAAGDHQPQVVSAGMIQVAQGWSTPVRLASSDAGHEDSLFPSPDGQRLYFTYYPGNLFKDIQTGQFVGDLDIYVSAFPFTTKQKDTRFFLSERMTSASGIMIDEHGDAWYGSNHHGFETGTFSDQDIYRNDQRLPLNDAKPLGNPHYCSARDELWLDLVPDTEIGIVKGAKASGFTARPQPAPFPINSQGSDFQPWLNADCTRMYWSGSPRRSLPGAGPGPVVYTATRVGEDQWSEPEPVVWSRIGVGEPGEAMFDGHRRLYFIALVKNGAGALTTDMFYTEWGAASAGAAQEPKQSFGEAIVKGALQGAIQGAMGHVTGRPSSSPPSTYATPPVPSSSPAPSTPAMRGDSTLPLEALVGIGSTIRTSLESNIAGATDGKALVWSYELRQDPLPILVSQSPLPITSEATGLTLRMRSADRPTRVTVVVKESGGAQYEYPAQLSAGGLWNDYEIPWGQFTLQQNSRDPNGRLDPMQITNVLFIDIGAFLGQQGVNQVFIDEVQVMRSHQ